MLNYWTIEIFLHLSFYVKDIFAMNKFDFVNLKPHLHILSSKRKNFSKFKLSILYCMCSGVTMVTFDVSLSCVLDFSHFGRHTVSLYNLFPPIYKTTYCCNQLLRIICKMFWYHTLKSEKYFILFDKSVFLDK